MTSATLKPNTNSLSWTLV